MKMKKPVCKLPLSLKMTLFVLFSFASLLYASNNYAQRTMLNISSQTRTVSEVLIHSPSLYQGGVRHVYVKHLAGIGIVAVGRTGLSTDDTPPLY